MNIQRCSTSFLTHDLCTNFGSFFFCVFFIFGTRVWKVFLCYYLGRSDTRASLWINLGPRVLPGPDEPRWTLHVTVATSIGRWDPQRTTEIRVDRDGAVCRLAVCLAAVESVFVSPKNIRRSFVRSFVCSFSPTSPSFASSFSSSPFSPSAPFSPSCVACEPPGQG